MSTSNPALKALRGAFLDLLDDPFYQPEDRCARYIPDGLLVLEDGYIRELGNYDDLRDRYAGIPTTHYPERLIVPGFIDTHVHYPQLEMIAAYGEQLLTWLSTYTFPVEGKFVDKHYARQVAAAVLDELLRNGTTTALVFATVFPQSVDAFFEEAEQRHMRAIAGKVMMDRNAPDYLMDTAESSYQETRQLIQKWHKRGRLLYAVTPRFAATSSEMQLNLAGKLLAEFPDVYLHTHLAENVREVELIAELYPESHGYLDVYDRAGLVGDRSVFAHGVQLTDAEFQRLSDAQAAIAFCPTSNLFLGSGLFRLDKAKSATAPVKVGLGTDVGAGTSFSILTTASEAYKVAQLRGTKLSTFQSLFLATLGGARALGLEDKIGNFAIGKEADFTVLDLRATPLMAFRNSRQLPESLTELAEPLFAAIVLGGDRVVRATYIMGELAYSY